MYNSIITERFQNLQYSGMIISADAVGQVGSISSGEIIKIYLRISNDVITEAKFKTFGNVYALVASDIVCEFLKNCTLENARKIKSSEINQAMGGLPENKLYIADLAQAVIVDAVDDYFKKLAKAKSDIKK